MAVLRADFSSPFLLSRYCDAHQMLERMLGGNFLDTLPNQREELFDQRQYRHIWSSIFETPIPNGVEDSLIRYALGIPSHSILTNRKIGVLGRGKVAILPPATRPGDEIHAFRLKAHDLQYRLLVLRPYLMKSGIDAGYPRSGLSWGETRHFTLVGFACMGDHNEDIATQIRMEFVHQGDGRFYNWLDHRPTRSATPLMPRSTTALIH